MCIRIQLLQHSIIRSAMFTEHSKHVHVVVLFYCITNNALIISVYAILLLNNFQPDLLCTGFNLLVVSVRRRLPLHDDDGTNSFWKTWVAQRNFLAQHGSQLGHIRSVNLSGSYFSQRGSIWAIHDFLIEFSVNYVRILYHLPNIPRYLPKITTFSHQGLLVFNAARISNLVSWNERDWDTLRCENVWCV